MEVYRLDNELTQVPASELATEQELDEYLITSSGAVVGDIELMYIDRQGAPEEGGIYDILAVDRDGDPVIVALKRDKHRGNWIRWLLGELPDRCVLLIQCGVLDRIAKGLENGLGDAVALENWCDVG